jgi:hypothetical protein
MPAQALSPARMIANGYNYPRKATVTKSYGFQKTGRKKCVEITQLGGLVREEERETVQGMLLNFQGQSVMLFSDVTPRLRATQKFHNPIQYRRPHVLV